jgi:hypothetical protein
MIQTVPYFDIPKRYFQAHFQIVDCDIFKTEMLHTCVNGVYYNLKMRPLQGLRKTRVETLDGWVCVLRTVKARNGFRIAFWVLKVFGSLQGFCISRALFGRESAES